MEHGGCVYILTNRTNRVLYTGVTSDLLTRIHEHKTGRYKSSFTAKYKVNKLVYYEAFSRIEEAIAREKQLKAGSRKKKLGLIERINPEWIDLYEEVKEW